MKAKTLGMLGGLMAPMIPASPTEAGFVGVTVQPVANDYGLLVCRVYAYFDRPNDQVLSVGGTPQFPLVIGVNGGNFFQHPQGFDSPPFLQFLPGFSPIPTSTSTAPLA